MSSIYGTVYSIIKASAPTGDFVDMKLLWDNLNEAGIEGEAYVDTIDILEEQGYLMEGEDGRLLLAKTEWRCGDCSMFVNGLYDDHIEDCRRRQRKQEQIRKDIASRAKMAENKASAQG